MRYYRVLLGLLLLASLLFLAGCIWISELLDLGKRIQVHDYTNVTLKPGHLLIPEGTPGAPLIAYTGRIGLGKGGSDQFPLDDTWTDGQFAPTPEDHAKAFDRLYFQIYGSATFDLGMLCSSVYIALSQDHGPYPEEALEYRVAVSNDGTNFTPLPTDTPITLFRRGWSAAGEDPITGTALRDSEPPGETEDSGPWPDVLNDDLSARWDLPQPARFIRITPLSASPPYSEPEIDAVKCLKRAKESAFQPGNVVKVVNTGDLGLNVRDAPAGEVLKTVPDGWTFKIIGGPETAALGGKTYNWWKVREEGYEPSPIEGWVAEDFLESIGVEALVPSAPPDYFIMAHDQVESAISWAISQEGKTAWSGYCLGFVAKAFGQESSGWTSPEDARKKLGNRFYPAATDWNPPRGALVFFSAKGTWCDAPYGCIDLADYGHIGIYLGNGGVVHAYGAVKVQSIVEIEQLSGRDSKGNEFEIGSYIGWAYPPREWLENHLTGTCAVNPTNEHLYCLTPEKLTWPEAESYAVELGGHLVAINDQQEQEWLVQAFGGDRWFWIGFTDSTEEGVWIWSNGDPVTYTNWYPGEPNNMWSCGEDYAVMNWGSPGYWNDLGPCSPKWKSVGVGIMEFP